MYVRTWFEIPTLDINRAQAFYENIFKIKMVNMDMANLKMRVFPIDERGNQAPGAIVLNEKFYRPTGDGGVLVYLNTGNDLGLILASVEASGGSIMIGKTQISEKLGFMAVIFDTEGNRIGLRSDY